MMKTTHPIYILSAFLLISCLSCKPGKAPETTEPVPDVQAAPTYPALGNQAISQLYGQADKVDMIFYNLPISVNQDDAASVKNTVLYVSPASPKITAQCQPLGRLSWMAQGAIIREADVYCDAGCEYLLFMEDNKPVAANAMGPEGVAFFKNIIGQMDKLKK